MLHGIPDCQVALLSTKAIHHSRHHSCLHSSPIGQQLCTIRTARGFQAPNCSFGHSLLEILSSRHFPHSVEQDGLVTQEMWTRTCYWPALITSTCLRRLPLVYTSKLVDDSVHVVTVKTFPNQKPSVDKIHLQRTEGTHYCF